MLSVDGSRAKTLGAAFAACRRGTLALFADVGDAEFRHQPHPEFSPIGWHLGHIAYTEALWLLCRLGGQPMPRPDLVPLFDVAGLSDKAERCALPPIGEVRAYAAAVRAAVLARLERAELGGEERTWRFVLQHEAQHGETVAFLRQLRNGVPAAAGRPAAPPAANELVPIEGGPVPVGSDSPDALDNERPRHPRAIGAFRLSRYPVTQRAFAAFIAAGGYRERRWWSAAGWAWREAAGVDRPLYWREGADDHPVAGVSAHEAEAWCRFRGVRLPTEHEWEKAAAWDAKAGSSRPYPWGDAPPDGARCNHDRLAGGTTPVTAHPAGRSPCGAADMLGNVWEWTASEFAPYRGFRSFPYAGYSAAYFDGKHRVLRGGSWASRPWALRASMRNWYVPETRAILAGFRYAKDGLTG